jgi:hypothetical protein
VRAQIIAVPYRQRSARFMARAACILQHGAWRTACACGQKVTSDCYTPAPDALTRPGGVTDARRTNSPRTHGHGHGHAHADCVLRGARGRRGGRVCGWVHASERGLAWQLDSAPRDARVSRDRAGGQRRRVRRGAQPRRPSQPGAPACPIAVVFLRYPEYPEYPLSTP